MTMQWLLLAIPWLNPSTYGPTHAVGQGLLSWFAAALCGLLWQWARTRQDAQARTVALAWALAAGLSALMGLLQYLGLAQHFPGLIDSLDAGQAYANLRQRNQLATLLAIGLCAVLYVAHQPALRQGSAAVRAGVHGLLAVLVVVLASADAASGSRTGMLQLLLVFGLALRWRRGLGFSALALLAYAAAAVLLPLLAGLDPLHSGILGRVSEGASPCNSRLTLWSNVLELIAQRPWWGWGWGELAYAHFMHLYAGPRFCEILGNAHNLPLHLAVTLGLPLALLLCTAACWGVWRATPGCFRARYSLPSWASRHWRLATPRTCTHWPRRCCIFRRKPVWRRSWWTARSCWGAMPRRTTSPCALRPLSRRTMRTGSSPSP